jgi:hypothetical protein
MSDALDFIEYIPSETQLRAASDYACRSLTHSGPAPARHICALRTAAVDALARLCLQWYLAANSIPFQVDEGVRHGDSLLPRLRIGGRRCGLDAYLASRTYQKSALRPGSPSIGQIEVLIPFESLAQAGSDEQDLQVFSAVVAAPARTLAQTRDRARQGSPLLMVARLEGLSGASKREDSVWLRGEGDVPICCFLAGISRDGSWREESLQVPSDGSICSADWAGPAFLRMESPPPACLSLGWNGKQSRIAPAQWINLWLYDCRIVFFGWLTRHEFRRRARLLPAGSANGFYRRTRRLNWAVPIRRLRPIVEMVAIMQAAQESTGR